MEYTEGVHGFFIFLLGLSNLFSVCCTCKYPGSPAHSKVNFNTQSIQTGTVATYSCESGFDLLGPTRRLCLENGTWIPFGIPVCVLNVALEKASMQSSVARGGSPHKAVDGIASQDHEEIISSCTSTANETNPWWYVNLLEPFTVQLVRVDFGSSCCAEDKTAIVIVRVGNNRPDVSENPECNRFAGRIDEGRSLYFPCLSPVTGAFVSVHIHSKLPSTLSICETSVYTDQALSLDQCPSFARDEDSSAVATHNGRCYTFHSKQPLTFQEAQTYCTQRDGKLIVGTSPALQGFLSWELYKRHRKSNDGVDYWNGAVWFSHSGTWKWYDGKEVTLSFWSKPSLAKNCSKFDSANGWLWSGSMCSEKLNFICQHQPVSCGHPGIPPNATMLTRGTEVGSEMLYRCDPGHLMVGPAKITCLTSGFYTSMPPTCVYFQCGHPANIVNGGYNLLNGTRSYKSTMMYFCHEGYVLVGRHVLICESDQKWDGPPPRCDPVACHNPPSIEFGNVTLIISSDSNGTSAEYSCDKGFHLLGPRVISCDTGSGIWDEEAPNCRVDRSKLLNGRMEGKHKRNRASVAARLNMGGIISLGIFGGFVFLAVIISIVVIIIRRSSSGEDSADSVSTYGTGDSRERLYEQHPCCERYPVVHHRHDIHAGHVDETENSATATDVKMTASHPGSSSHQNHQNRPSQRRDLYHGHTHS